MRVSGAILACVGACLLVACGIAAGQELPQARVLQDSPQPEIKGGLLALRDDSVLIRVDGQTRDLPLAGVRRIDLERRDSLKNGAWIGAAVLGGWCALVCGQGLDHASQAATAVAVNTAFGALIGVAIDAGHRERITIYSREAAGRAQRWPSVTFSYRQHF